MERGFPVRRRAFLAGTAGMLSSLAGCSTSFTRSEKTTPEARGPPPLYSIQLYNHLDDEISLTVIVERDGDVVEWGSRDVPPSNANPEENYLGRPYLYNEDGPFGCGTFEVTVRQRNTERWSTIDFREIRPARGKQIRPVRLDVKVEPGQIAMETARIEEFFSCERNRIVSEDEYLNGTAGAE